MGLGKGLALSALVVARVTESGVETPVHPSPLSRSVGDWRVRSAALAMTRSKISL
jgi:hypothetical protein